MICKEIIASFVFLGWYYWENAGTPVELKVGMRTEMTTGTTLIVAQSLPPSTTLDQITIYAQHNRAQSHTYSPTDSLESVRTDPGYDKVISLSLVV